MNIFRLLPKLRHLLNDAILILRKRKTLIRIIDSADGLDLAFIKSDDFPGLFTYPIRDLTVRNHVADALTSAVHYIKISPVSGDVAEFGVGSGWTSGIIARALARMDDNNLGPHYTRNLYLFDSFAGLPLADCEADKQNPLVKSGIWREGSCNWNITPSILNDALLTDSPSVPVFIYKGWFKDALLNLPRETKLAFIHLDCDLYESTIDVLLKVFADGLVAKGAIILFDDWACNASSPDLGQQKAWAEAVERFRIEFSDLGPYMPMGRIVVVNNYRDNNHV